MLPASLMRKSFFSVPHPADRNELESPALSPAKTAPLQDMPVLPERFAKLDTQILLVTGSDGSSEYRRTIDLVDAPLDKISVHILAGQATLPP